MKIWKIKKISRQKKGLKGNMTSSNKVQLQRNEGGRKKERQKGRNKQNKVQLKRNEELK